MVSQTLNTERVILFRRHDLKAVQQPQHPSFSFMKLWLLDNTCFDLVFLFLFVEQITFSEQRSAEDGINAAGTIQVTQRGNAVCSIYQILTFPHKTVHSSPFFERNKEQNSIITSWPVIILIYRGPLVYDKFFFYTYRLYR